MTRVWCLATLALSLAAAASWTAQAVVGGETVFAVVSNVAFVADVVLVPFVARSYLVESHPMVYGTTLLSALLTAGSFAHHLDRGGDPAHTLDIAMGWILYLHLALLAAYTLAQRFVVWPRLLLALTLAESAAIVAMFSAYDVVRRYQVVVLVGCGAAAHGCTLAHRLLAGVRPSEAALDFAALVLLQAVATTAQGQMWYRSASPVRYNVEHGYWHILNGTIVGVVVVQTAQLLHGQDQAQVAAPAVRGEGVCRGALVLFGLVLLAATLLNGGEEVVVGVLVPAQAGVLLVAGAVFCRSWCPRRTPDSSPA